MKWIDYTSPKTLEEAVGLLAEHGEKARILAGGTDLIVLLRVNPAKVNNADVIVDGKAIPELNELSYSPESGLTLERLFRATRSIRTLRSPRPTPV